MITEYIPLTPEQKYFATDLPVDTVKIEPPIINAALGTIIPPVVPLNSPGLAEVKPPANGNYVWWILGVTAVVVIGGGVYWFLNMKKKPNQQAPKNIDQVNTEMKALPEKKQVQKEIASSQTSPQVTEKTSVTAPVSQQSPPQAPSNLANFPDSPADASTTK